MKMKTKDYRLIIYIIITLAVLLAASSLYLSGSGEYVRITEGGNIVGIYPINQDTVINLTHNTVTVKDGEASMSEADCPDGLCIKQGAISHSGEVIACLPNRVTVQIISGQSGNRSDKYPLEYSGIHFDTLVNASINDMSDSSVDACGIIRSECERFELICSRTNPSSELYKLNHGLINEKKSVNIDNKEYTAYKVSDELYNMISTGIDAYDLSDGAFDIAIGAVTDLWDFKSGDRIIPDKEAISSALSSVSIDSIRLLDNNYIAITDSSTVIDLGGLAKGYIGDSLRTTLINRGVTSATISLGGNVVTIGDKAGEPYNIGIVKPFTKSGEIALAVPVSDQCVITSGTYERCFTIDGVLYHHILNPDTGYPYDTDLSSATVICDSSLQGDILSTVLLSEGSSAAISHADALASDGIYVILIDTSGEIIYNSLNK